MRIGMGGGARGGLISPKIFLYVALVLLCLIVGPLIVVAGPRGTILFIGAIVGIFLIAQSEILLFLTALVTLVIAGVSNFFLNVEIYWASYGLASVLFGTTLLHVFLTQNGSSDQISRQAASVPSVLPALLTGLLVYSLVVTLSNGVGSWELAAALKQYVMIGGIWAALSFINFRPDFIKLWLKGFVAIALLQLPFCIYQYIFVRSFRISAGLGTVEASDSVVGTFGGSFVSGGYTASTAAFLIIATTLVCAFYRRGLMSRKHCVMLASACIAPLFIMEVKAIFIFIPVCFLVLFKDQVRKRPLQFIGGSAMVLVFLAGMVMSYQLFHWSSKNETLEEGVGGIFGYSFLSIEERTQGGEELSLSRFSALQFWWRYNVETADNLEDVLHVAFGYGLGASHWGGKSAGSMAVKYYPLELDYTGATAFLWDLGVVGLVVFLAILFYAFRLAGRLAVAEDLEPWERALAEGLQATIPLFLLFAFYKSEIPHGSHMMFMLFGTLGLLGWLSRQTARKA